VVPESGLYMLGTCPIRDERKGHRMVVVSVFLFLF
jgi:hypothetical protein